MATQGLKPEVHVVVVGAGLAGLACARTLKRAGVSVQIVEATDGIGGRVRTDEINGYRVDRGFQVLFTEYPSLKSLIDRESLDLRRYAPGALIARGDRRHVFADPFRDPESLPASVLSNIVSLGDKWRAWRLSAELGSKPIDAIWDGPDQSVARFLRMRGFTPSFLEVFARPFFGGIFLDRSLGVSAQLFQTYWKMLVLGDTATPALGMGQLPASMSEGLDIRFHAPVAHLRRANDRVTGVVLEDGETLAADFVVLATDPFVIDRLAGIGTGRGSVGTTTLWVGSPEPIVEGRKIVLHANQNPFVHHIVPVSNVAPQTAPVDRYLTALCLGDGIAGDNDFLMQRAVIDLARLLRGDRRAIQVLSILELVAISRTPHAQLRQPPGFRHQLFSVDPGIPGLRITGELADTASIDGALASGVRAARSLITQSGSVDTDHPGKSVCPTG